MFNKALIIGILLVGASFSISANEVQKWEYLCTSEPNLAFAKRATEWAKFGWELVSITSWMQQTTYHGPEAIIYGCFKKLKKS